MTTTDSAARNAYEKAAIPMTLWHLLGMPMMAIGAYLHLQDTMWLAIRIALLVVGFVLSMNFFMSAEHPAEEKAKRQYAKHASIALLLISIAGFSYSGLFFAPWIETALRSVILVAGMAIIVPAALAVRAEAETKRDRKARFYSMFQYVAIYFIISPNMLTRAELPEPYKWLHIGVWSLLLIAVIVSMASGILREESDLDEPLKGGVKD